MNTSENRLWALVGPLTVALWVGGIILINHNGPADHSTGSQILAWYRSGSNRIIVGGWLFSLGWLGFVTFVAGLRVRLAEAAGRASQLPALALAGAAMAGVLGMLSALGDLAAAVDKNDINPAIAAVFHHSTDLFFIGAELAAAIPLAEIAIAVWRTRALPRWWGAFAGLVAVLLAGGPTGWIGLIFGVPLFTLGTSLLVLLRRPWGSSRPVAATA
jgi:hypothetical protein